MLTDLGLARMGARRMCIHSSTGWITSVTWRLMGGRLALIEMNIWLM